MWGRGREGVMAPTPLSAGFQSLPLLPAFKLGPSRANSRVGGWVCARSRPLWVSPKKSPVRLGVSPAASTPTGIFNQWFEALFPPARLEPWVGRSVTWSTNCCPAHQLQLCPPHSTIRHVAGSAAAALLRVLSTPAARLHPSYRSG